MKVRFYQGLSVRRRWYWRVVAANGRIVADGSEGYVSKANARRAFQRFLEAVGSVTEEE